MGYYTKYKLNIDYTNADDYTKLALERTLVDSNFCDYAPLMDFITGNGDSSKWYDHDEDMLKLSTMFPSILFTLEGRGEEQGDWWRKYYKGGKIQESRPKIIFDDFDENKLVIYMG